MDDLWDPLCRRGGPWSTGLPVRCWCCRPVKAEGPVCLCWRPFSIPHVFVNFGELTSGDPPSGGAQMELSHSLLPRSPGLPSTRSNWSRRLFSKAVTLTLVGRGCISGSDWLRSGCALRSDWSNPTLQCSIYHYSREIDESSVCPLFLIYL